MHYLIKKMEKELIVHLGLQDIDKIPEKKYLDMAKNMAQMR